MSINSIKNKTGLPKLKNIVLEKYAKKTTRYPKTSIVVVTLDSLRYDVAEKANTPNINKLFKFAKSKNWVKVGSHGTYTLPSHISMFHGGIFPCDNRKAVKAPFNRQKKRLFKAELYWNRTKKAMFPTPEAENIVKGFEKLNYRTIGIGGVRWFDNTHLPSNIWGKYYFREFYWQKKYSELDFKSIYYQIKKIKSLNLINEIKPIFLFLNVSMTHTPYLGFGKTINGQVKALEKFDEYVPRLISVLPKEYYLFLLSDHGDCFGEEGLWGHGFYHPKVMEVPFNWLHLNKKITKSFTDNLHH